LVNHSVLKRTYGLGLAAGVLLLAGCFHDAGIPAVDWDRSAQAKVVEATFCCGFVPYLYVLNYVPAAQLWGDGRIVWSYYADDGRRVVMQGALTEVEIKALLDEMAHAGFFRWEERYADHQIADASDQCITVYLTGLTKQVCEYVAGAPPAFHLLYQRLADGIGASGEAYVPERAYLTAHPVSNGVGSHIQWPADAPFALNEVEDGRWVEGEILQFAWEVVNENLWNTVRQGGSVYQLSVQTPDLVYFPEEL